MTGFQKKLDSSAQCSSPCIRDSVVTLPMRNMDQSREDDKTIVLGNHKILALDSRLSTLDSRSGMSQRIMRAVEKETIDSRSRGFSNIPKVSHSQTTGTDNDGP